MSNLELFLIAYAVVSSSVSLVFVTFGMLSMKNQLKKSREFVGSAVSTTTDVVHNSDYHRTILRVCYEKGLKDAQIMPNADGKLSLFDMDSMRKGTFNVVSELVEPRDMKVYEDVVKIMTQKIDDYLSAKAELKKEEKDG